jgi:hypothetical protein
MNVSRREDNDMDRYDAANLVRKLGGAIDDCKESTARMMQGPGTVNGDILQWRRGYQAGLRKAIDITDASVTDDTQSVMGLQCEIADLQVKFQAALNSIEVYVSIITDMEKAINEWRLELIKIQRQRGVIDVSERFIDSI